MMIVTFVSDYKNKKRKKCIEKAVTFYENILWHDQRKFPSLRLDINVDPELLKKEATHGYVEYEDRRINPRHFTIYLNDGNYKDLLTTLAHEMTHVYQYSKGYLVDTPDLCNKTIWKGKLIEEDKMHYYDTPWEIEASGREFGMYLRFMEKHGNKVKGWDERSYV